MIKTVVGRFGICSHRFPGPLGDAAPSCRHLSSTLGLAVRGLESAWLFLALENLL